MTLSRCSQATRRRQPLLARSDGVVPAHSGSEPERRTARRSAVQRGLDSGFTPQVPDDNSQAA
jgi:hypothetical protein